MNIIEAIVLLEKKGAPRPLRKVPRLVTSKYDLWFISDFSNDGYTTPNPYLTMSSGTMADKLLKKWNK